MRTVTRVVIAATLAFSLGCASTDWIDRTLVTVDVTGTWYGSAQATGAREFFLELKQEGSRVTGFMRVAPIGPFATSVDGTVAGDVFRFRDSKGNVEGELTVSGDEMNGRVSILGGSRPISLRRVDPSPRPASPPR